MAVTITFSNSKAYTGPRSQPLADLVLVGTTARFSITGALVDSGADLVQVPLSAGIAVGWLVAGGALPPGATIIPVRTVGAPVHMVRLPGALLEVEGIAITADILLHPSGTSRPLIGRNAFIALKNVGFNISDWLW